MTDRSEFRDGCMERAVIVRVLFDLKSQDYRAEEDMELEMESKELLWSVEG